MEKQRWPEFLSDKIKSQISIEIAEKAQTWGFAILGFISFGFALGAIGQNASPVFLYSAKLLFLALFHLILILSFYLPALLQKGQKSASRLLNIQDTSSLVFVSTAFIFYAVVVLMLSSQAVDVSRVEGNAAFLSFAAWTHLASAAAYLGLVVAELMGFLFLPNIVSRILNWGTRGLWIGFTIHGVLFLMLAAAYAQLTSIGSPEFFEQFRIAGLFWTFIAVSIMWTSMVMRESALPALAALELEVASGKLDRPETILTRYKEAFISRRFDLSIRRVSHSIAEKAHEIAKYTHDAVSLVDREKPSEMDLRQVEDRYRRAEALYKKLEKESQRFLIGLSIFNLAEAEREKSELVRDQFSRELRNAKIELASVRKRIDERLVLIKNTARPALPELTAPEKPVLTHSS